MSRVRKGAYKKSFFNRDELTPVVLSLWPTLAQSRDTFLRGEISAAEMTAHFLLTIWRTTRPTSWHSGTRTPALAEVPITDAPALRALQVKRLRGIPPEVFDVLLSWHRGVLPLELMFRIPSADEVIAAQTEGRRCVSVLIESPGQFLTGGEDRDSLSFALHDLIHASHFYRDPLHFQRQVFFSRWMSDLVTRPGTRARLAQDSTFTAALEYLVADMNTHWVHSVKCLKSIVKGQALIESECLASLRSLVIADAAPAHLNEAWDRLNRPDECEETRREWDQILQFVSEHSSFRTKAPLTVEI